MQELLRTTSSLEFEEFGGLRLLQVAWPDRGCRLHLRVWSGEPGTEFDAAAAPTVEEWLVECRDVRAARLVLERADRLTLASDHPLLWSYRQGEAQLTFRGRPAEPAAVVAALWAAHRALVGDWIPFGEHLNIFDPAAPIIGLLDTGGGVLAAGPRPLLDAYASVLSSHQLETSFVGGYRLGLIEGESDDFAVLLFGGSYVIGSGFAGHRIDAIAPLGQGPRQPAR